MLPPISGLHPLHMRLDFLLVLPPQSTNTTDLRETLQTHLLEKAAEVIPIGNLEEEEKEEGLILQLLAMCFFLPSRRSEG